MFGKRGGRQMKGRIAKFACSIGTIAVLATGVFVFSGYACVSCQENTSAAYQTQPVSPTGQTYTRQVALAFSGGNAVIGLFDDEITNEFAERQPLTIPLERLPNRIIMQGLPEAMAMRGDGEALVPAIGDIIMDTDTREIALWCQDSAMISHGIRLGHVISGMEELTRQDGQFEAFATKP